MDLVPDLKTLLYGGAASFVAWLLGGRSTAREADARAMKTIGETYDQTIATLQQAIRDLSALLEGARKENAEMHEKFKGLDVALREAQDRALALKAERDATRTFANNVLAFARQMHDRLLSLDPDFNPGPEFEEIQALAERRG